jgi:hypothetical protein
MSTREKIALYAASFAAVSLPARVGLAGQQPSRYVEIESSEAVTLQRQEVDGEWKDVCTSPCRARVPVPAKYRVAGAEGGSDVRSSEPFVLHAAPDDDDSSVTLVVKTGSKRTRGAGTALLVSGGLTAFAGTVVAFYGVGKSLAEGRCDGPGSRGYDPSCGTDGVGGTIAGAGLGVAIGGVVMLVVGAALYRSETTVLEKSATRAAGPDLVITTGGGTRGSMLGLAWRF